MAKDLLIEIGIEELPARFIDDAQQQLLTKSKDWLENSRIGYKSIQSYSTPRRLAVLINSVEENQTTIEEEVKGPAMKIAKDETGNWTKAAIGFTKGQGKTTDDIYVKEIKGTSYIYVTKRIEGKSTITLLSDFQNIIESISFASSMRWGDQTLRYARPIRWIVALFGEEVIPLEVASVQSGNFSSGHRFLGKAIKILKPADYESILEKQYVFPDPNKREQIIRRGIESLEKQHQFIVPIDFELLHEVRNLVEYPTVFVGSYDASYLNLPEEVLITSMKEHQRYFPVQANDGTLLPKFIGVRNGDEHALETVIRGNEKVLHARLSDAQFFYHEDQKQTVSFYQNKLENVVFQEKLGTIADKVRRMEKISRALTKEIQLDVDTTKHVLRATAICKFDLMTNMVNEFPELQGTMGKKYAAIFGEDKEVCQAIEEHYLPNSANGPLPESTAGAIVSISDKLDTIVGCLSVGLRPTGSQDPYGLRRQAIGILRILIKQGWSVSVDKLIRLTAAIHDEQANLNEELVTEVIDFMKQRATFLLKEMAIETDVIEAVMEKHLGVFPHSIQKAKLLSEKRNEVAFKTIEEALVRVLNIAKKAGDKKIDAALFKTDSERHLYERFKEVRRVYFEKKEQLLADEQLEQLSKLAKPIHQFFDENMVMDKDETIRTNRLSLMHHIAELILDYANLSVVEWKQHF